MSNHMWAQLDTLRASDMITKARNIKGKNYITINKYSLDVKDCLQFAEVKSKRGLSACQFEMYDNPFFMLGEGGYQCAYAFQFVMNSEIKYVI
ncbi:hypothetical protein D5274_11215 [bacterium 1XD42-94]|nr:hypothetical protein [bacterium 1XD42-76]NBK05703.1 hypothetical protein [bacterium 1XD42-94]